MTKYSNKYSKWFETAPKELNAGLTIIKKIKDLDEHIILVGGNYINGTKRYEMFGGKYEPYDKTSLHTALREFTEELFNIKLPTEQIDKLVTYFIDNDCLINNLTLQTTTSISFFASFKTLELIYNFIINGTFVYLIPFDFAKFIEERNSYSNCIKADGLCEIQFIGVIYLSKAHMLPLRKFTQKLLKLLRDQLKNIE